MLPIKTRKYSLTASTALKDILINHVRETGNYNRWMLDQFCDILEVPVKEYCEQSVGAHYNRFLDPTAGLEYVCFGQVAKPLPYELINRHITREIVSKYLGDVPAFATYLDDDQIVRIYSYAAGFPVEERWMRAVHYHGFCTSMAYPYYDGLAKRTAISGFLSDGAITIYKISVDDHFDAVAERFSTEFAYVVDEQLALREAVAKLETNGKTLGDYSEPELLAALTANIVARSSSESWMKSITEQTVSDYVLIAGRPRNADSGNRASSYLEACKVLLVDTKTRDELLESTLLGKVRRLAHGLVNKVEGELTLVATNF